MANRFVLYDDQQIPSIREEEVDADGKFVAVVKGWQKDRTPDSAWQELLANPLFVHFSELPEAKDAAVFKIKDEINLKRDNNIFSPIEFEGNNFHCDLLSKVRILATYSMAQRIGESFTITWGAIDGDVELDYDAITNLGELILAREKNDILNARSHKASVQQVSTYDEAINYDFSSGWDS